MIDYRAAWEQATAERDEARAERDELLAEIALELHMTMDEVLERIGDYREASAAARRYREALERIAELSGGGEYAAEIARQALADQEQER